MHQIKKESTDIRPFWRRLFLPTRLFEFAVVVSFAFGLTFVCESSYSYSEEVQRHSIDMRGRMARTVGHIETIGAGIGCTNGKAGSGQTRVGTENSIANPTQNPRIRWESDQHIAFDGVNFFILWNEDYVGSGSDLFGTRVSTDGTILDPSGFRITSTENAPKGAAALAWNGERYLVVYDEVRADTNSDILASWVYPDGSLATDPVITISDAVGLQYASSAASNGEDILVAWGELADQPPYERGVHLTRIGRQGKLEPPEGFLVAADGGFPSIAFGRDRWLIAWTVTDAQGFDHVLSGQLNREGQWLPESVQELSSSIPGIRGEVRVKSNGDGFLVLWSEWEHGITVGDSDIVGVTIGADGIIERNVSIGPLDGKQAHPAIAWAAGAYQVVWANLRSGQADWNIWGARVTIDGQVLDPQGIQICSDSRTQWYPEVAEGNGKALVAWSDESTFELTAEDIWFQLLNSDELPIRDGKVLLTACPSEQLELKLVGGSEADLMLWSEKDDVFEDKVLVREFPRKDRASASAPIVLATAGGPFQTGNEQTVGFLPGIALCGNGGGEFLAIWPLIENIDNQRVYSLQAKRLDDHGAPFDRLPIVVVEKSTEGANFPAVASNGFRFFVIWEQSRSDGNGIYGAFLDLDGTVHPQNGFPVFFQKGSSSDLGSPAVVWNGSYFLVSWASSNESRTEVQLARVTSDGELLGGDSDRPEFTLPINPQFDFSLAWDGRDFAITWADMGSGTTLYGSAKMILFQIDGDEVRHRIFYLADDRPLTGAPALVWDGQAYWVSWDELDPWQQTDRLYVQRLPKNGWCPSLSNVANEINFPYVKTHVAARPALVTTGVDDVLLGYRRAVPDNCKSSARVFTRIVSQTIR